MDDINGKITATLILIKNLKYFLISSTYKTPKSYHPTPHK